MVMIVSGGQTGVDRAALDAALAMGVEAGGWCPEGRTAEDGIIPDRYPVIGLPGAGYPERTRQNVIDSDGTLIIYFGFPAGGTELTNQKMHTVGCMVGVGAARRSDRCVAASRVLASVAVDPA